MDQPFDIFVIGGGINGTGIARDAQGRGLSVGLAEKGDLAGATSSASTKLFHGGLRYLEHYEFGLVRKALVEREVLLRNMPHISWPMRFVLPVHREMRPWWLIRAGLFLYDNLGGREILPGTRRVNLRTGPEGAPLKDSLTMGYEYSDCWVEDSRLVVLNARDAGARGATVLTRAEVISARRDGDLWQVTVERQGRTEVYAARALVNAGGPWVADIITGVVRHNSTEKVRLVRGSHIVTKKLFEHEKCYFFQGGDGRIIFAIPYETDFTLIGTTDQDHQSDPADAECTPEEAAYLCRFASDYFKAPVTEADIVCTYSGVRPLYDDGASSATKATRDYVLSLDDSGAPLLNVFGGKITTYRKLAENAWTKLAPFFPGAGGDWTHAAPLPGGDFAVDEVDALVERLASEHPYLDAAWARRLIRAYGTEAWDVLGGAREAHGLGRDFGATLTAAEVDWLVDREYAMTGADIVWRRSKLGLRLTPRQIGDVDLYLEERRAAQAAAQ